MSVSIKYFIREFNNLCRNDICIKNWSVCPTDSRDWIIDVDLVDYKGEVTNYHMMLNNYILNSMGSIDEIRAFAKNTYYQINDHYMEYYILNKEEKSVE